MSDPARPRRAMRIAGRSYLAFVLTPQLPLDQWLTELDEWTRPSAGFFIDKPVVLDLSAVRLSKESVAHFITELQSRNIRIMGIEGVETSELGPDMPPVLRGGRAAGPTEAVDAPVVEKGPAAPPTQQETASLLLENPVRSGQSVVFPAGDVTVLGTVASGAEIVAGGSIHVYGTLRGRALAGSTGNQRARIFCHKAEAELLAIDGVYLIADDLEPKLRGRPIQAWLEDDVMLVAPLN